MAYFPLKVTSIHVLGLKGQISCSGVDVYEGFFYDYN